MGAAKKYLGFFQVQVGRILAATSLVTGLYLSVKTSFTGMKF